MPRLFVLSGDDVGHTHDFDTALVLGRAKDADMRMRGASISRKHARIEPDGTGWKVTDLGSANGVFVAGERVKSAALEDGAEFRLGDVELRLRTTLPSVMVPKPAPAPPPFEEAAAQTRMVPGAVAPAPAPKPKPEPVEDDGFELEGDWSDDPPPPPPPKPPPKPEPRATPASAAPAPSAAPRAKAAATSKAADLAGRRAAALGKTAGAAGARATTSGKRILQYNKVANAGGLGGSELAQQPAAIRWLLYLLAIAVFAGLAWGAFKLTSGMRAGGAADVNEDF